MNYPAWLQIIVQVCVYFITAFTPIAIIVWMVLRRVRDREGAIRPGAMRLLWWFVITAAAALLLVFASGGHRASREVEGVATLTIVVLTGVFARMLWVLYGKIGLPRG